jgi:integration host factor subunit beta
MSILTEKQNHLSYKIVESAVKEVFEMMSNALENGERIEIRDFGSFSLRYRSARGARNPKTGELVTTLSKYAIHFKPGKELRERVNMSKDVGDTDN